MSTPKTLISGIGSRGKLIVNELKIQGLYEADFMDSQELIEKSSLNIFILFLVYDPRDNCMTEVDKITNGFANKGVVEIILSDKTNRKTPHYLVANLSTSNVIKEVSTLIKTFVDLGKYPSLASIDPADIVNSLIKAERLQMEVIEFEMHNNLEFLNRLQFLQNNSERIEKIWIQIYLLQTDNSLSKILEKLFDTFHSKLNENVDILWNVSDEDPNFNDKAKCVFLY